MMGKPTRRLGANRASCSRAVRNMRLTLPLSTLSAARRWTVALAALGVVSLLPAAAQAVSVLPGDTLLAVGEADPTGGLIVATLTDSVGPPGFSASLTTTVTSGDPSNPFGGLTFTYLLSNDPGSTEALVRITFNGFDSFLTDVSFQTPAGGAVFALQCSRYCPAGCKHSCPAQHNIRRNHH